MSSYRLVRRGFMTVLPFSMVLACAVASASADTVRPPTDAIATFDGQQIDLATDWGAAHACAFTASGNRCYRTVGEMNSIEAIPASSAIGPVPQVTCASPLKIYADAGYGGAVLSFSTRSTVIVLSSYGFDNVTSSYQVGGCSAIFYDSATGTGTTYPGSTATGASATSMTSGWDNRISSIHIN